LDVYIGLTLAGLSVSFLHAILPNHWLPFVLAGRAQRWSLGKTLWVVTLAGGGHVLITTVLGILIVGAGLAVAAYVEAWSMPLATSVLILFGVYYIVRHFRGGGHGHSHFPGMDDHDAGHGHEETGHDHHELDGGDHDHHGCSDAGHTHHGAGHDAKERGRLSPDTVAVASLIAMLTFSPCEGFLPIYLTAWPHGWTGFLLLSVVLAAGTLAGMIVFTGLTYAGVRRLQLPWLERYEHLILGAVLVLLGIAVMGLHH
jgi:nickel/cobalt transporter (NicO) family protein